MKVTMQQLADKVGVSKMTISLYLRNPRTNRISDKIKEKIEESMAELGYEPPLSCQFGDGRKVVAILLPFDLPIFKYELIDEYLNGIQSALFANGYDFIFLNVATKNGVPVFDKATLIKCRSFSGVILFGTRYTKEKDLKEALGLLRDCKIPSILLNYPKLVDNVIQGVCVDDNTCAPVDYLISLGHRRIAFMGGTSDAAHTEVLFKEYCNSIEKTGSKVDDELIFNGGFEGYSAYNALNEKLRAGVKFSALFCMSTQMMIGCYRALKENGLRIPEDISVINYGDPYFTEFLDPPLTTVSLPLSDLGRDCTNYLLNMINQGIYDIDYKIIKQNTLVVRRSTAVFR